MHRRPRGSVGSFLLSWFLDNSDCWSFMENISHPTPKPLLLFLNVYNTEIPSADCLDTLATEEGQEENVDAGK